MKFSFVQLHQLDWESKIPSKREPGLILLDIKSLEESISLTTKDKFKEKDDRDLLMSAGSHFGVIIKDFEGKSTCILDYDFKKKADAPDKKSTFAPMATDEDESEEEKPPKKTLMEHTDQILRIGFDATFELGPIGFSLLGFTINLKLTSLDLSKIEFPKFSLEGFAVAFEKPPLTIAGIVRHGNIPGLNYYAGGISGVTGGFGYNSGIRVPKVAEITEFTFIDQSQLSGAAGDVLETLKKLTDPRSEAGGWFTPRDDTYWAAAGMTIDAFQMISLDAVVMVMFGQSVKLGIHAVALVDIPNAKSPVKFAHVELAIGVTVDFDYGTMKVEGQLSPKSFILNPNCHLMGAFALYYWFYATHPDKSLVGNFVFALGRYHQAFKIPDGWPNPPRLGISWSLGSHLSLSVEAYFAITPKFDALANFLLNYKPFRFTSNAGICVGVRFNIDVLFIHTHISVEIGADLSMWGPPLAGRVHVDVKVAKFDINFGADKGDEKEANTEEFYHLILQASSQETKSQAAEEEHAVIAEGKKNTILPGAVNQGHTFLATSGLLKNSSSTDREQNADWAVRGGSFSFVVGCKMEVQDAKQVDEKENVVNSVSSKGPPIYARPMHLKEAMTKSEMKIEIAQDGVARLWAKYDESQDPTKSSQGNNIDDLLDIDSGSLKLIMSVLMQGPPAIMFEDTLKAFNILAQGERVLKAKKPFPETESSEEDWSPSKPKDSAEQWNDVHNKWSSPEWNEDGDGGGDVQQTFFDSWFETFGWGTAWSGLGKLPKLLGEIEVR
ncbi:transcriptional activator srcap [Fusarium acutatum]|uniref:Transcriptional activator srcap n=1 Tax=Fusarium acutatum TaxID=78861 RepID=A0A8H4K227_9HYPO|nr:transcriptional activator srcap [Fusarium acutatum]